MRLIKLIGQNERLLLPLQRSTCEKSSHFHSGCIHVISDVLGGVWHQKHPPPEHPPPPSQLQCYRGFLMPLHQGAPLIRWIAINVQFLFIWQEFSFKGAANMLGCLKRLWVDEAKTDQRDESVPGKLLKWQKPPQRNLKCSCKNELFW